MKNCIKTITSLLLSITIFVLFSCTEVFAQENVEEVLELEANIYEYNSDSDIVPLTFFSEASITVNHGSEGMDVYCVTWVNGDAAYVGVKDIVVWHKGWFGIWKEVAVSSGGTIYNNSGMGCSITYSGAEVGDTYKITCVHYAEVNGVYREVESDSGEFKYW